LNTLLCQTSNYNYSSLEVRIILWKISGEILEEMKSNRKRDWHKISSEIPFANAVMAIVSIKDIIDKLKQIILQWQKSIFI
jgi:hypothetical protein